MKYGFIRNRYVDTEESVGEVCRLQAGHLVLDVISSIFFGGIRCKSYAGYHVHYLWKWSLASVY